MTQHTITPWFPVSTPPIRKGVYNVSCRKSNQSGDWYSFWDGVAFNWFTTSVDKAKIEYDAGMRVSSITLSWRGIAK